MTKRALWAAGLGVGLVLLGVGPGSQAAMLARTFPSHVPQVQVQWQEGAGLFSPTSFDDSCFAVFGARTDGAQVVYYQSNRIYSAGVPTDLPLVGAASGPLPSPLGDCFGALPPTVELGMSAGDLRTDVFIALSTLVGASQVALLSTVAWTLEPCGFASGTIISAPNPLYPATGLALVCSPAGPPVDVSGSAEIPLGGGIATGFEQPALSQVGSGNRIVCSSLSSDLVDLFTGLTATESAHDWFVVFESTPSSGEAAWATSLDNVYNLEGENGPCG